MPLDKFNKNAKRKDGLQTFCRECSKIKSREYYSNKPDIHKRETKKNKLRYQRELQKFIFDYLLENHCANCGETNPVYLEFDHLRDKEACVSHAVSRVWSIKRVKKEIDKCQVLCANCHRMKTAKDQGWYTYKLMYNQ